MKTGKITMSNGEVIPFEIYDEEVPVTAANFIKLVNDKYYDGKTFHRVISGFVSQGGCPYGNGTGDLGYTIPCECDKNIHKHVEGTLSMAHRGRDTGCCQFFICHAPQPHLDGVHTVFGCVLDNMKAVKTMHNSDKIQTIRMD